MLAESKSYRDCTSPPSIVATPGDRKWRKPCPGFIKINCDVALPTSGDAQIAFVGRDGNGVFLFAGVKTIAPTTDVELAEAEAALWALNFAKERGLANVHIESDCLALVSKAQKGFKGHGTLSHFICSIRSLFQYFDGIY